MKLGAFPWPALLIALLIILPDASRAAGLTSPLTGITLPGAAQRLRDQKSLDTARPLLEKLAQSSGRRIGRMEVYHWDYAPGVPDELDRLLQQNTDLYKKLPEVQGNGLLIQRFVAASQARKVAYLGMWVTQGAGLYLAWGEIVTSGARPHPSPPAPTPPSVVPANAPAPAPRHAPSFPRLARRPGIVQGTVLDRSGRPMPGVSVSAWFAIPSQYLHTADVLKATTDARGHYAINVKETVALGHVAANRTVEYLGKRCPLPFRRLDAGGGPRDSDVINREAGDIVNFTPALSGLRESDADPDNWASYFGNALTVDNDSRTNFHSLPAGSRLRLVLTPRGPLLDGSAGRVLVRDTALNNTSVNFSWSDIPIGAYLASATLVLPGGGVQPVQATARIWINGLVNVLPMNGNTPLFFPPDGAAADGTGRFASINLDIAFP